MIQSNLKTDHSMQSPKTYAHANERGWLTDHLPLSRLLDFSSFRPKKAPHIEKKTAVAKEAGTGIVLFVIAACAIVLSSAVSTLLLDFPGFYYMLRL